MVADGEAHDDRDGDTGACEAEERARGAGWAAAPVGLGIDEDRLQREDAEAADGEAGLAALRPPPVTDTLRTEGWATIGGVLEIADNVKFIVAGTGDLWRRMIELSAVTFGVIFGGLMGAIIWDLITWYFGLPTSSSHALIGGYAGAAIARAGFAVIIPAGWTKTLIFIVLAPLMGMGLGLALSVISIRVVETIPGKSCMALELPNPKRQIVRLVEILSSTTYNDAPANLAPVGEELDLEQLEGVSGGNLLVEGLKLLGGWAFGKGMDAAVEALGVGIAVGAALILRLAVYEFLHEPATPGKVIINEALELARAFSGDDAVRFINGVVDAIRKKL
mgnify:CR=1 FL=1